MKISYSSTPKLVKNSVRILIFDTLVTYNSEVSPVVNPYLSSYFLIYGVHSMDHSLWFHGSTMLWYHSLRCYGSSIMVTKWIKIDFSYQKKSVWCRITNKSERRTKWRKNEDFWRCNFLCKCVTFYVNVLQSWKVIYSDVYTTNDVLDNLFLLSLTDARFKCTSLLHSR